MAARCGETAAFLLASFLVLELLFLQEVEGCSCPPDVLPRDEAIRRHFCSYSGNIYSGVIVEATCNCLPDMEDDTLINCWHYQLLSSDAVNITTLSSGRCDAGYSRYNIGFYEPSLCSDTGRMIALGLTSMGPLPVELTLQDFSPACSLSCAFNTGSTSRYQCLYIIRVHEVFKGTISVEEMQVSGPDTHTPCGSSRIRLQVGTEYLVNLGHDCSPISRWAKLSSFSSEEIELVRSLQNGGCDSTTSPISTTSTDTTSTTPENDVPSSPPSGTPKSDTAISPTHEKAFTTSTAANRESANRESATLTSTTPNPVGSTDSDTSTSSGPVA